MLEENNNIVVSNPTDKVDDSEGYSDVIETQKKAIRNYFNQIISKEKKSNSNKHDKENQK